MIGIRIKTLRKENGWNQQMLAEKIGVGRTTITEYELERISPPYEKLVLMSELFGVTVRYITGESNSRTEELSSDDVSEQIAKIIYALNTKDQSLLFDGVVMDSESKKVLSSQLESALNMIRYVNKLNTR